MYRGTFGTGLFQCIYQPGPAHWAMLPSTLEWHLVAALLVPAAIFWPLTWIVIAAMFACSFMVAGLLAAQARLAPKHHGFASRLIIMGLCYVQPLVRSWVRYRTRLFAYRAPEIDPSFPKRHGDPLPLTGSRIVDYWTEEGYERTELLALVIAYLNEHGWGKTIDSGWEAWDLEIYCHPWSVVQISTAQEDHGGRNRLIRVRYRLRLSDSTRTVEALTVTGGVVASLLFGWLALAATAGLVVLWNLYAWWTGTRRASRALAIVDGFAERLRLFRCLTNRTADHPNGQPPPSGGAA
jgi:hypothetical protein